LILCTCATLFEFIQYVTLFNTNICTKFIHRTSIGEIGVLVVQPLGLKLLNYM